MRRKKTAVEWLRMILGLAALWLGLFAAVSLINGPLPAYSQLTEFSGTYLGLEQQEDTDGLCLLAQAPGGVPERFLLSSILPLDTAELSQRLRPGDPVTVRYQSDESRNVYELTGADGPILTYAQSAAADRENRYWGYGLVAAATAAALGLLGGWTLWDRRRQRRAAAEEDARRKQRAAEAAAEAARTPVVYAPDERTAVESYIRDAFGPIARVFHEPPARDIQVDIAVVEPSESADFYKLVTIGMGARRMDVPPELAESNRAYAELAIFLPPEWNLLGDDEADTWPFTWLKRIARMPVAECDWVTQGNLFSADRALDGEGNFTALLLAMAAVREGSGSRLLLPSGRIVNFYQLYPLREEERAYARERGAWHLWQRMQSAGVTPLTDLYRESCCQPGTWFGEDIAPFLWTEESGVYSLGLFTGDFLQDVFDALGRPGDGGDWETAARAFVGERNPGALQALRFSGTPAFFCVESDSEAELRGFALAFRDFCGEPEQVRELLLRTDGPGN